MRAKRPAGEPGTIVCPKKKGGGGFPRPPLPRFIPVHGRYITNSPLLPLSPLGARGEQVSSSRSATAERHFVVNCVERVLGKLLGDLDLTVPHAPAIIRLAGGVGEELRDRQAGRSAKRAAHILVCRAAGRRSTRAINHLADMRQVNRVATHRRRGADLVAAECRVAEVNVQRSG